MWNKLFGYKKESDFVKIDNQIYNNKKIENNNNHSVEQDYYIYSSDFKDELNLKINKFKITDYLDFLTDGNIEIQVILNTIRLDLKTFICDTLNTKDVDYTTDDINIYAKSKSNSNESNPSESITIEINFKDSIISYSKQIYPFQIFFIKLINTQIGNYNFNSYPLNCVLIQSSDYKNKAKEIFGQEVKIYTISNINMFNNLDSIYFTDTGNYYLKKFNYYDPYCIGSYKNYKVEFFGDPTPAIRLVINMEENFDLIINEINKTCYKYFQFNEYNLNYKNDNDQPILHHKYIDGKIITQEDFNNYIKNKFSIYFINRKTNLLLRFRLDDYLYLSEKTYYIYYNDGTDVKQYKVYVVKRDDSNNYEFCINTSESDSENNYIPCFDYNVETKKFSLYDNFSDSILKDLEFEILYYDKLTIDPISNINDIIPYNKITNYFEGEPNCITNYFNSYLKLQNIELNSYIKETTINDISKFNKILLRILNVQNIPTVKLNDNKFEINKLLQSIEETFYDIFIDNINNIFLIITKDGVKEVLSSYHTLLDYTYYLTALAWNEKIVLTGGPNLTFALDVDRKLYKFKTDTKVSQIEDLVDNYNDPFETNNN